MKRLLQHPRWPAVGAAILVVILLSAALFALHSAGFSLLSGTARAAPQALTAGQVAALEGAQLLLSPAPPSQLFLPVAVR